MSNTSLTLQQLTELIMDQARDKGFGTSPQDINVAEKMALIHTEVSEAFTAYRHKNMQGKDGFAEELGDIIQRVLHLCGAMGIDVEAAILQKLAYNKDRVWDWSALNESGGRPKN
jgi:NTP pyrophosphatase (non-canonical NTP hydrolase)